VNGDGFNDMVFRSYYLETIFLYFGKTNIPAQEDPETNYAATFSSGIKYFGWECYPAGDVNNDGIDDFLASSNYQLFLIFGSNSLSGDINLDTAPAKFVLMLSSSFRDLSSNKSPLVSFYTSVAVGFTYTNCSSQMRGNYAGDVNNDGYDDFLIGCYDVNSNDGIAAIVYGAASYGKNQYDLAVDTISSVVFTYSILNDTRIGSSVAGVGDVNNDGYDDVLIGREWDESYSGSVFLIYGGASLPSIVDLDGVPSGAGVKFFGAGGTLGLGGLVEAAGDINQDGTPDLFMGGTGDDGNGNSVFYIIYGSDSFSDAIDLNTFTPPTDGFKFQRTYANGEEKYNHFTALDLNGDLIPDTCICSPYHGSDGKCWLLYGPVTSSVIDLESYEFIVNIVGDSSGYIGKQVFGRDVNGDGRDDLLMGSENLYGFLITGPAPSPSTSGLPSSSSRPSSSSLPSSVESPVSSPSSVASPSAPPSPSRAPIDRQERQTKTLKVTRTIKSTHTAKKTQHQDESAGIRSVAQFGLAFLAATIFFWL